MVNNEIKAWLDNTCLHYENINELNNLSHHLKRSSTKGSEIKDTLFTYLLSTSRRPPI